MLASAPPAHEPMTVVVLPLRGLRDVDEGLAQSLQGRLEAELDRVGEFTVTSSGDVNGILEAIGLRQQLEECSGAQCEPLFRKLAGAFDADAVAVPKLGRVGSKYTFDVSMASTDRGTSLARFNGVVATDREDELLSQITVAAESLRQKVLGNRLALATPAPPRALTTPSDTDGVSGFPVAPAVAGGVGLAIAGVGVGLGLSAVSQADRMGGMSDQAVVDQAYVGDALLWTGSAVAVAGLTWLIVELVTSE